MCANFQPAPPSAFRLHFEAPEPTFEYREAYPGSAVPIILRSTADADERCIEKALFGLIPTWAKDRKIARKTYNARSETVAAKPSYRHAWAHRHFCLVPVQGFYEPCYESGKAVRWKIHRQDDEPFALAAIWGRWQSESGEAVHSCSLLTVNADASPLMRRFHGPEDEKRSVVVVPPERRDDWLDAEDSAAAQALLTLFDPAGFTAEAAPRVARPITSR